MHAGTPESFVYYTKTTNDAWRADYLLSNGERRTRYSTLSSGTTINTRNWDMYKDKELDAKGYIKEIHAMTKVEAIRITGNEKSTTGIRNTGNAYWIGGTDQSGDFYYVSSDGTVRYKAYGCHGVRPVIELNDGVYIASGNGTEADPYVLAKE